MRHQDLTINHVLETWVYANAAARISAVGFVAGDIGRIAYQSDTGQYWRLTGAGPPSAWGRITASPFASLQTTATTPTGTTSNTGVMMGLAGLITPAVTGKILMTIAGTFRHDTVNGLVSAQIRYFTGTAPANGAAPAGTAIGAIALYNAFSATANRGAFSLSAVVTGLTVGTQIWIDLVLVSPNTGTASIASTSITAVELP